MSKFELYNILLKELNTDSRTYEYLLDDGYFKKIDSPEVQKGLVNAKVVLKQKSESYELSFVLNGFVIVACNRCLDDMEQPIQYKDKLIVKLGNEFAEEDDVVIVPESEGAINIAWFLYEFIVLNIPIKHIHNPGECNKTMVGKLKRHITRSKDDENDTDDDLNDEADDNEITNIDPRWEGLQNIIDNN